MPSAVATIIRPMGLSAVELPTISKSRDAMPYRVTTQTSRRVMPSRRPAQRARAAMMRGATHPATSQPIA